MVKMTLLYCCIGMNKTLLAQQYSHIVQRVVLQHDPLAIEMALADAAELGRVLVQQDIPPEELTEFHHLALLELTKRFPALTLAEAAQQLTAPLMEALMAYSLAFRQQLEHRAQEMVNARLEQSRRLEAVGTLAAGIAHDFNNIVGAISGFAELLAEDLPETTPQHGYCQRILQGSARARDLINRLLTFARTMPNQKQPVDVVRAVHDAVMLLQASLPPNVELRWHTTLPAAWVIAEPSQIQQLILNLTINAADAMAGQQGLIDIQLDVASPTADDASLPTLRLTVRDNGEGMSQEVQQRVFDPFFTTKAPGKGSGLGLSVVHGIVSQLGGMIQLQSRLGDGSEFILDLPQIAAPAAHSEGGEF